MGHGRERASLFLQGAGGGSGGGAPASLEAIRQKVLLTTHTTGREVAAFTARLAPQAHVHTDLWLTALQLLLKTDLRKSPQELELDHVEAVLRGAARKLKKPAGKESDNGMEEQEAEEIEEMLQMCEISREFDMLVSGVLQPLKDAYHEQLRKFCLSFEAVGRGLDIPILRDYENKIIRWDGQIQSRLASAERAVQAVRTMRLSLTTYIEQYRQVVKHMSDFCEQLTKVFVPMKRWVSADAAYSTKVQLAINELNQKRFASREKLKSLELEREQVGLRLRRGAWNISGVGEQLNATRRERQYLRAAEARLQAEETRLASKVSKADAAAAKLKRIPPPSREGRDDYGAFRKSSKELLAVQLEAVRTDLRKVEADRSRVKTQLAGVRRENVDTQRRLEKDVDDLKSLTDHQKAVLARRQQLDHMIKVRKEELADLDEQLEALKRIRKVKDRSDMVRKIHQLGHLPSDVTESTDPLKEAIQLAADDVGHDWPALYTRLHFRPPRRDDDRRRDIIEIEETPPQLPDYSGRRQAIRGLQLWRRLSQSASLLDLTTALRNMRKQSTVNKIEKKLLTTR